MPNTVNPKLSSSTAATSTYTHTGTEPPPVVAAITTRNATELNSCTPVATPDSQPRCSSGVMSARSAVYGSTATLKKIENKKMTAASSSRSLTNAPATKNNADSGIPTSMKGRRRPKRVQTRSDRAQIVGWMTAPSMLRVLDNSPMSRSGAPNDFKMGGRTKLLNE